MCELCDLVEGYVPTHKYYSDSIITIVDCLTCGIPMITFNHHGEITEPEKHHAIADVGYLFLYDSIRTEQKKLKDHIHWHLSGNILYLGNEDGSRQEI